MSAPRNSCISTDKMFPTESKWHRKIEKEVYLEAELLFELIHLLLNLILHLFEFVMLKEEQA